MEQKKTDTEVTYWHPAFYADIQIELEEDADNLVFENEHQIGKKPMEIDVLVIKKETSRPVKKNIGRIFRKYNIIEYKSPDDSLSIDDFYKVYGYTCFFKADVPHVDSIPVQELTITFISERYPVKFLCHLQEVHKYKIEKADQGIYYIKGDLIPIQVIVTKKLSRRKNLCLRSLTNKLSGIGHAQRLVADYREHKDNSLYESVLDTIIRANQKTFKEVNSVNDLLKEIMEKCDRILEEKVEIEVEKRIEIEVKKRMEKGVDETIEKAVDEAVEENTKQVAEKTKMMERIMLVQKKCKRNKSLSVIADEMETEPDEILTVYEIISKNQEKTVEELYELAMARMA